MSFIGIKYVFSLSECLPVCSQDSPHVPSGKRGFHYFLLSAKCVLMIGDVSISNRARLSYYLSP